MKRAFTIAELVVAVAIMALVLTGTWARWNDRDPATFRWRLYRIFGAMVDAGAEGKTPAARERFKELLAELAHYRRDDTADFIDSLKSSAETWLKSRRQGPWQPGIGVKVNGTIEEAHKTLAPLLGSASSWVFAVSLLASGLSSATVGTMAGQVVMQGFVHRQIPIWLRRLLTMLPALIVIGIGLDPTRTLVLSQVILSFGLPFALVPLALFTARSDLMGVLVNRRPTTAIFGLVTLVIIALNIFLMYQLLWAGG